MFIRRYLNLKDNAQIGSCSEVFQFILWLIACEILKCQASMSFLSLCEQGPCGELHFRPTASNRSCQRSAAVSF